MAIETTEDYQKKEARLEKIKKLLEAMTREDDINIANVVKLREEAIILVKELRFYLKKTFEKRS